MLRAVAFCAHAYVKFKSSGTVAKCPLRVVFTSIVPSAGSQEWRFWCPYTRACYKAQTIKGAHVSIVPGIKIILVFRLVTSQGKYAFRNTKCVSIY